MPRFASRLTLQITDVRAERLQEISMKDCIREGMGSDHFAEYRMTGVKAERVALELDGSGGGGYGRRVHCHNCGAIVRATKGDGSPGKELRVPYPSHGSKSGRDRDAKKANELQAENWLILRYTSGQLEEDPFGVVSQIEGTVAQIIVNRQKWDE